MTQPDDAPFVDPELDGTNAAIARDMREAAEAANAAAGADDPKDDDPNGDEPPARPGAGGSGA